jgi:hypothetical protein
VLVHSRKSKTTLALLQTFQFHAQTRFWVLRLTALLPTPGEGETVVQLTSRDVLELELGPLNTLDAQFVEWLAEEYGAGARVSVRRGWRDVLGLVFALGGGAPAPSSLAVNSLNVAICICLDDPVVIFLIELMRVDTRTYLHIPVGFIRSRVPVQTA